MSPTGYLRPHRKSIPINTRRTTKQSQNVVKSPIEFPRTAYVMAAADSPSSHPRRLSLVRRMGPRRPSISRARRLGVERRYLLLGLLTGRPSQQLADSRTRERRSPQMNYKTSWASLLGRDGHSALTVCLPAVQRYTGPMRFISCYVRSRRRRPEIRLPRVRAHVTHNDLPSPARRAGAPNLTQANLATRWVSRESDQHGREWRLIPRPCWPFASRAHSHISRGDLSAARKVP